MKGRRQFSKDFKAKLAIEAIKETVQQTVSIQRRGGKQVVLT